MPVYLVIASQLLCPVNRMPNIRRLNDDLVEHLTKDALTLEGAGGALDTHIAVLQSIVRWKNRNTSEHCYRLGDHE